jgi:hypothetical protein
MKDTEDLAFVVEVAAMPAAQVFARQAPTAMLAVLAVLLLAPLEAGKTA